MAFGRTSRQRTEAGKPHYAKTFGGQVFGAGHNRVEFTQQTIKYRNQFLTHPRKSHGAVLRSRTLTFNTPSSWRICTVSAG